jgi:hypothetical protein
LRLIPSGGGDIAVPFLGSTCVNTDYPLHSAGIRIIIADTRCKLVEATAAGADSEDIIFLAVLERLLHTAAECPSDRVDQLIKRWMTDGDSHRIEYDAKICAAEYVQDILYEAEAAAVPVWEAA